MTYEEAWDIAYAIGYHARKNPNSLETDRNAYRTLLASSPDRFRLMIGRRFREGLGESVTYIVQEELG